MTPESTLRYEIQTIGTVGSYSYRITDRLTDSRIATSYIWEHADLIVKALNNAGAAKRELAAMRKEKEQEGNPWENWGSEWRWKLTPVKMVMTLHKPPVIYDAYSGVRAGIQYAAEYLEQPSDQCPVCTLKGIHSHAVGDIQRLNEMSEYLKSKLGLDAAIQPLDAKEKE